MLPLRQMLFGIQSKPAPAALAPIVVQLGERSVTVVLKRHATARRMVLRLSRDGENFTLTMPRRQTLQAAKTFIQQSQAWMQNTQALRGRPAPTSDTLTINLRGVSTTLQPTGKSRGLVVWDQTNNVLHIPGTDEHWKRRLVDWLKQQAEIDLRNATQIYAEKMSARFAKLTVRDQKSRWGSCTADGCLSYSWRLILAPPFVLDYVAAHEVAHLIEMNHGPGFWRLVLLHCKHTRSAKAWLKSNGHTLHHGI